MYRIKENFNCEKQENEMIMVDSRKENVVFLKEIETEIIELLEKFELNHVISTMKEKYEGDPDIISSDIINFVDQLIQKEIIEPV